MSDSDAIGALLTLAEIGIGLVGFAGLVLAVTRRHSKMSRSEVIELRELVRAGLGGVALALFPVGALLLGATGPSLWRWASAIHVLIIVGGVFGTVALAIRRTPVEGRDPTLPLITYGLGSVGVLVQGANVLSWPFPVSAGGYFSGRPRHPRGGGAVLHPSAVFPVVLTRPPTKSHPDLIRQNPPFASGAEQRRPDRVVFITTSPVRSET